MSSSADRRPRRDGDTGFSLVEVVVALGIFGVLVVMMLPAVVVGLKSNDVARQALQEKGFAQTEVERMRNLPFHVAPAAGDFIDVLDRFYPRLTAPTTTPTCGTQPPYKAPVVEWTGYVGVATKRCPWEPTGAFYRTVKTAATDQGLTGFVLVIDTQFLSNATPPVAVTPAAGYDTRTVGRDAPPTQQIGVTVSVFRTDRDSQNPMTTYTQIGRRDQLEALVESEVDVTAVQLGTASPDGLPLTLTGGLLGLDASLTFSSRASAVGSSTTTGIATGQQASGASTSVSAPPAATVPLLDGVSGSLDATGCDLACWGGTRLSGFSVTADGGLPNVGSSAAPVRVSVRDLTNQGMTLGAGTGAAMDPGLGVNKALVTFDPSGAPTRTGTPCGSSGTGEDVELAASGYLTTTAPSNPSDPSRVEACGNARTAKIAVLPTGFAPSGIVRVTLENAYARCVVTGAGHAASTTVSYRARVEVWQGPGPTDYSTVADVTEATASDELAAVPLTTALGGGRKVGDYISSWSTVSSADVKRSAADGAASVEVPGIVDILTQPVRRLPDNSVDPVSSVSLSVGVLSCSAVDRR